MSRIHERIKPIAYDGTYIDGAVGDIIEFIILTGGNAGTVTLMNSDSDTGSSPVQLGQLDYDGTESIIVASVEVRGDYKRYYGVTAANAEGIVVLTDVKFTDESIPKSAVLVVQ